MIRDLLLHLEIINDNEYEMLEGVKNLYNCTINGRMYRSFNGKMGTYPHTVLREYIQRNGTDGLHIVGDIICIYRVINRSDVVTLYHKSTIKLSLEVKNNIIRDDMIERIMGIL